jgi:hypothetical protein
MNAKAARSYAMGADVIIHSVNSLGVGQRATDGDSNVTGMCQAAGERWNDYRRAQEARQFLEELARSVQIPTDLLAQTIAHGPKEQRGIWVHPQAAIHLAMWGSPAFAVKVTAWVEPWYRTRRNPAVANDLSYDHGLLGLIREVWTLLHELDMYEAQDRLLLAATRSASWTLRTGPCTAT